MINLLKILWLLCFLGVTAVAAEPDSKLNVDDHLIPIEGWLDPAYKELLTRRLFLTPANYARLVEFPSLPSLGEISVAIHSEPGDPGEVFITRTRGERNLWSAEFASEPSASKEVKISRCDAPFPKSTAMAVRKAVRQALEKVSPLENPNNAIIVDATVVEFSIEEPQRGRTAAFLSPYAIGRTGAALRKITELLTRYCDTKPTERPELVKQIENEARRLR